MTDPQSFDAATRLERIDDTTFGTVVPDGWQQGRGAFGGLVIGLALRALDAYRDDAERPLRAATSEIPSPVMTGETRLEVTPLRRGKGVDALEVHVRQEGEVRARLTGVYGKPRPVDEADEPTPPTYPSERELAEAVKMPPPFATHFEMRPTGPLPFSGHDQAIVEGWVRPRVPFARLGAPELAALADVYWPSFFSKSTELHPSATIAFMLQLTPAAFRQSPDASFYFRSRQLQSGGGFSHELRELWSSEGELLALNPQTFAIIK